MSYAEIAELKGQSESAIRGLVARALSRLSGIATRAGILPPPDGAERKPPA
jgi:DNA-directed RNA polymerase specialized sigma24 family protein